MKSFVLLCLVPSAMAIASFRKTQINQPGQPQNTKVEACDECRKYAPHLDREDDCVCFASDVYGTFENDATKESVTANEYGFDTANTGQERLPEGWKWHCRPISDSGAWKQCD